MAIKHYKILIPDSVKISLNQQVNYIAVEQAQPITALKWLDGIIGAIQSLSTFPERCSVAHEDFYFKKSYETTIRHFIYKKSFRIIFTIKKNEVRILSVKHGARIF
jgi:toxin ParE1/3/4